MFLLSKRTRRELMQQQLHVCGELEPETIDLDGELIDDSLANLLYMIVHGAGDDEILNMLAYTREKLSKMEHERVTMPPIGGRSL